MTLCKPIQIFVALVMMLLMSWLTISLPFITRATQQVSFHESEWSDHPETESAPLAGATEEKTESQVNSFSEYLHHANYEDGDDAMTVRVFRYHHYSLYVAFHPELISPPPEV